MTNDPSSANAGGPPSAPNTGLPNQMMPQGQGGPSHTVPPQSAPSNISNAGLQSSTTIHSATNIPPMGQNVQGIPGQAAAPIQAPPQTAPGQVAQPFPQNQQVPISMGGHGHPIQGPSPPMAGQPPHPAATIPPSGFQHSQQMPPNQPPVSQPPSSMPFYPQPNFQSMPQQPLL